MKRLTQFAVLVAVSSGALAGCAAPSEPAMELQSGQWSSSDGVYWVEIDEQSQSIAFHLPEVRTAADDCADPERPGIEGEGLFSYPLPESPDESNAIYILFDSESRLSTLNLSKVGDFRTFAAYPCGVDAEPVLLVFETAGPGASSSPGL